jgi:hypothetical protein
MESGDVRARCTCIYSTSRERKRLCGGCFHPRPGFRVGKISPCASAWLDESPAWVLRESLFYECTTSACNSPVLKPFYGGLHGRFPWFAPMRLPFTSHIVEHSHYLPKGAEARGHIFSVGLNSAGTGSLSVLLGIEDPANRYDKMRPGASSDYWLFL